MKLTLRNITKFTTNRSEVTQTVLLVAFKLYFFFDQQSTTAENIRPSQRLYSRFQRKWKLFLPSCCMKHAEISRPTSSLIQENPKFFEELLFAIFNHKHSHSFLNTKFSPLISSADLTDYSF